MTASLLMILSIFGFFSEEDSYSQLSIENDFEKTLKLRESIETVRQKKRSEPGIEYYGDYVIIQGSERPDLFRFSDSFVFLFFSFQEEHKKDPNFISLKWKKLYEMGMSLEDINLLRNMAINSAPIHEKLREKADKLKEEKLNDLRILLSKERSQDGRISVLKRTISLFEDIRISEEIEWANSVLQNLSSQSKHALSVFIKEYIIPGSSKTVQINISEASLEENLQKILDRKHDQPKTSWSKEQ